MMAPEYYIFTGEVVPDHVTHVLVDKALKFVRKRAFLRHPNIEEVICHDGVKNIELNAFYQCRRLRRVIMSGVKEIDEYAFNRCRALTYIECSKLERIGGCAFQSCKSLSSIDLPSIKIVETYAFDDCTNLTNAKLGKDLESIRGGPLFGGGAFCDCTSLERIALPLKGGMLTYNNTFRNCEKLDRIDLVGGIHETVAALLLEKWKNDMNVEIDSINEILPITPASCDFEVLTDLEDAEKDPAIQRWMSSVLRKIVHYKAEHCRYVNEAAATLQPVLPHDILFKSVLPFLELPSHTFDGED